MPFRAISYLFAVCRYLASSSAIELGTTPVVVTVVAGLIGVSSLQTSWLLNALLIRQSCPLTELTVWSVTVLPVASFTATLAAPVIIDTATGTAHPENNKGNTRDISFVVCTVCLTHQLYSSLLECLFRLHNA